MATICQTTICQTIGKKKKITIGEKQSGKTIGKKNKLKAIRKFKQSRKKIKGNRTVNNQAGTAQ